MQNWADWAKSEILVNGAESIVSTLKRRGEECTDKDSGIPDVWRGEKLIFAFEYSDTRFSKKLVFPCIEIISMKSKGLSTL
jgi:hypothetical protein